jgi:hypothetical protein
VIVTDGHENASREWTKDRLHQAITEKLDGGNWTFTYLGTQPETWADASGLGIRAGATASYQGARAGDTYSTVGNAVRAMVASGDRQSRNLFASRHNTTANRQAMRSAGMSIAEEDVDPLDAQAVQADFVGGGNTFANPSQAFQPQPVNHVKGKTTRTIRPLPGADGRKWRKK